MSDFQTLATLACYLTNGVAFMITVQLPPDLHHRLAYAPIIYGAGGLSVYASSHITWLLGILPGVWGMFICYGLCHMTSILYISPVRASSWTLAYKLWVDPRRQTDPATPLSRSSTSERAFFVAHRILKAILCWVFTIYVVFPALGKLASTSEDFAASRQVFIRRIPITLRDLQLRYLGRKFAFVSEGITAPRQNSLSQIPITLRDIQIRCACVFGWNLLTYLIYDTCHIISSIICVGILHLDTPQEFPPLFGSPLEAYSVRRYWSRFSHRLTVSFSATSGKAITRQWLGKRLGLHLRAEKVFIVLWTFILSAACHTAMEWSTGEYSQSKLRGHFYFYLANFCAGALETFVLPLVNRAWKTDSMLRRMAWSHLGRRIIGYVWVFSFFFWISPKFQYPDLFDAFRASEQVHSYH